MTDDLLTKRVKVFQTGGWKYEGTVLQSDDHFITILDDKLHRKVMLGRSSIFTLEVMEE